MSEPQTGNRRRWKLAVAMILILATAWFGFRWWDSFKSDSPKPVPAAIAVPDCKPPVTPAPKSDAKYSAPALPAKRAALVVHGSQQQITNVVVQSPGVTVPQAPPNQASQSQVTNVYVQSPATPPPMSATPPPTAAPLSAMPAPFKIIVALVNYSEVLKERLKSPLNWHNRRLAPFIEPEMHTGRIVRYGVDKTAVTLVKSDGSVLTGESRLGERNSILVNEAVIPIPRSEVNFDLKGVIVSGPFLQPPPGTNQFEGQPGELAASAARGSAGIILYVIAAPPSGPPVQQRLAPAPPPAPLSPPQT